MLPTRLHGRWAASLVLALLSLSTQAGVAAAQQESEAVLQAHAIPADRREAIESWRGTLPPEIRTVWDDRTGRLLLFAPLETHGDLMRIVGSKNPALPVQPVQRSVPPSVEPRSMPAPQPSQLRLQRLSPTELHGRLEALAKRPLPATWDSAHTILSFPATLGDGGGVDFRVDAKTGAVAINGPEDAVAAWRGVVIAMEESLNADATGTDGQSSVRIVSTSDAPRDRIQTALKAIQTAAQVTDGPVADRPVADVPQQESSEEDEPDDEMAEDESVLGPVRIEFVEGLDVIVLRGDQADVDRVMKIIDQIESLSAETTPEIKVRPLKHIDADSLAQLLSSVYEQVLGPRVGELSVTGLAKPNALLLVGRTENVQLALGLVDQLDKPVEPTNRFVAYPLQHAAAADVKALIDEYFEQLAESGDEETLLLSSRAFVVADYRSNVVIVSAAPRDQVEVRALIKQIDTARGNAVDEVRIFRLQNALATDLAETLQNAINPAEATNDAASTRAAALRLGAGAGDPAALESGILTGVRVAPDARANSLVVTAPAGSMNLIAGLIERLDQSADTASELKVFAVANGNAETLAAMLRTIFGSEEDAAEPGGYGSGGLAPLNVTTDLRTNSIIAAGNAEDLAVVEAILLRLDDDSVRSRETTVYRLKNAEAAEVAEVLNEWLESERTAEADANLGISPREQIEREVVVVAEQATNSLIISATPRYEAELRRIVEQLDERPPMVTIQVLIAEVELNDTDEFGVELGLQDSLLFDRSLLNLDNTQFITTTRNEQSPGGATITTETQEIVSSELIPGFNFNNTQPLGNNGSTQAIQRAGNVAGQALSNFALGRAGNLGFGGFVLSASSGNLDFLLRALQENRRLEVLSRPQITTLDGKPGRIQVGARVPTIRGVTQNQFGGQTNNIVYEDVGIILEVTPRVTPDGQVVMNVTAEKSSLGAEENGTAINTNATGQVIRAPQIEATRAITTVSSASGQTIILSGLLTKETNDIHRRVPLLADIPLLGDLFRYDLVQESRSELLIILTPRILRSECDAEMLKQVESSRMSWVMGDVIGLHGPAGLRTRGDDWDEAESCYPGCLPTEQPVELPIEPGVMYPELGEANPSTEGPADTAADQSNDSEQINAVSYESPATPRLLPPVSR